MINMHARTQTYLCILARGRERERERERESEGMGKIMMTCKGNGRNRPSLEKYGNFLAS